MCIKLIKANKLRRDGFMTKQQIINLLNIGENKEIEFKESKKQLPKSLWSTYSAFANSKGRNNYFRSKREQRKQCIYCRRCGKCK